MYSAEMYAFIVQALHYKILYGPKSIFRKEGSPIHLVCNHDEFIVEFAGDPAMNSNI